MRISDWSSDVCSSDLFFLPRSGGFRHDRTGVAASSCKHAATSAYLVRGVLAMAGGAIAGHAGPQACEPLAWIARADTGHRHFLLHPRPCDILAIAPVGGAVRLRPPRSSGCVAPCGLGCATL